MSFAQTEVVSLTTASGGSVTGYTENVYNGWVDVIAYTKDGTAPFATGVDFSITTEDTGQNVWVETNVDATKSVSPRKATHDTAGVASVFTSDNEPVEARVRLVNERLKFAITNGGDTKDGSFRVVVVS